jgi:segregation and condensation protein A
LTTYAIHLDNFEGPLDLLLHLIKKHEMDIYDIPMAKITSQYLALIDSMKILNLDIAGEYLLMAATLVHIKSKMLLPKIVEDDEEVEEEDPRAELVRRLLEYQKYKEAAIDLDHLPQLDRDVFVRTVSEPEVSADNEGEFVAVGLFDLIEALQEVLKKNPEPSFHEISLEQLSVTERVNSILTRLHGLESLAFNDLLTVQVQRNEVIVTFLAMLELVKMRMVRLMQNSRHGTIWIFPSIVIDAEEDIDLGGDDSFGYS